MCLLSFPSDDNRPAVLFSMNYNTWRKKGKGENAGFPIKILFIL